MALIATGALYLRPMVGSGAWIAGDSPFYLAVARAVADNVRDGHGLLGWSSHDLGGFPVFSLFMPAAFGILATVAVHWATSMPLPLAYKIVVAFAVLLPPLVLWFVLERRVGAAIAFLVANLGLLFTYHLVQPLNGSLGPYLAAGLLVACMSVGEAWMREGPTWMRSLSLVLLAFAVVLCDGSSWTALPLAVVALALTVALTGGTARRAVGCAFLTLSPLALWLLVLTAGGSMWGAGSTDDPSPAAVVMRLPAWLLFPGSGRVLLDDLGPAIGERDWLRVAVVASRVLVEHIPEFLVFALVSIGVANIVRTRRIGEYLPFWGTVNLLLALLLIVAMLIPRGAVGGWLPSPERLVPYANVAFLGVAAMVLARIRRRDDARPRLAAVLLALPLVVSHAARYSTYGEHVLLKTADRSVVYEELTDVWRYLRSEGARTPGGVLYETMTGLGFLDGGASNVTALSTSETGLPSLTSWRLPSLTWVRRPPLLAGDNPLRPLSEIPAVMRRWNCVYLVVWWPGTAARLRASGAFDIVHESTNRLFAVLRLTDYEPSWLEFERPVRQTANAERVTGAELRFSVENPWAGNRAVLKMNYHPGWHLRVNGKPVSLLAVSEQIGTAPLPAGSLDLLFTFSAPWDSQS